MNRLLSSQNINTAVAAVMMLLMNITGGQLVAGLTPLQRQTLQSPYIKWLSIVAVFYVGTRDIWMTLVLTGISIIILEFIYNEHSRYYLFRRQRLDGRVRSVGTGALVSWGHRN
jgi:hypothetical protein